VRERAAEGNLKGKVRGSQLKINLLSNSNQDYGGVRLLGPIEREGGTRREKRS